MFHEALDRPATEREAYVRAACGDDRALADEALELLAFEAAVTPHETVRPLALAAEAIEDVERRSLIGSAIGRYRIEAEIASGGMGRVFKARRIDGDVQQVVALKLMRVEMFNPALLKRFSSERKILASLNHPGIAHLIDAGTDERGTPFVAMEYVDGQPLHEYCAQNLLPIRARVELFRQVLAAVAHAHRNLVVHRDLKPDNVLVTADGRVKLLDFGIAKELDLELQHTATAQRFFTPAYAAPEQLDDSAVSVACDVYGLGAVLYTVLTGEPPFDFSALTQGEIERTIRMVPPVSMSATVAACEPDALRTRGIDHAPRWAKALKGDLEQIVQKALRKEASRRYPSVEQFDDDLGRYLEQLPVSASGDGRFYRLRKFCERNALGLSVAAAVLVLGALGVGQIIVQNEQIRFQRDRTVLALNMLQEAFASADPLQIGSGDIRGRTILASVAEKIFALEKRDPELFRDLAYRIGEIQLNLGIAEDGLALIKRANNAQNAPTDAGVLLEIRGLVIADRLAEARAMIDANRDRFENHSEFLAEKAHLLYLEKRYDEAIAIFLSLLADDSLQQASVLRDRIYLYVAEAYRLSGRVSEAIVVLERQVAEQTKRSGDQHPSTLISRLRLSELNLGIGKASVAEREISALKPALDAQYDQNSLVQGHFHNILGQTLTVQGRWQAALEHFRMSLVATEASLGSNHENVFRAHLNVAQMIAYNMQDRREAYQHYLKAIVGVETAKGPADSLNGFFRLQAAMSYYWDQDKEAARRILTPPYAVKYFPNMPPQNQEAYLAALYHGFGPQDCKSGAARGQEMGSMPEQIAKTLMCRYDPEHKHRPKD